MDEVGSIAPPSPEVDDPVGHELLQSLSAQELERLTLLQQLLASANQPNYLKRHRSVVQKLGLCDCSVR